MACALAGDDFDSWLTVKLQALNTDEAVFSSYIKGILEGDDPEDEKNESLKEFLSGITENQISSLRDEIVEKWQHFSNLKEEEAAATQAKQEDVDERLVRLMESKAKPTIAVRNYTEEERKLKEAILLKYENVADADDDGEDQEDAAALSGPAAVAEKTANKSSKANIEKNTNFEDVVRADKEKRERAKQEAMQKKEKDKEDREKQKQAQQEKKEKRKTQKGERRR
ncbi:coiled-coil domain-containing protein 43 [Cloeon dipterum]|uniref:coiled-coil domain-containing protein 43 n=1 Tax=Cloeon dipterum TaxID=197152 RepID=UPI003220186E